MDTRTGSLLSVQWFLFILPLCIGVMALYPIVMTLFFSGYSGAEHDNIVHAVRTSIYAWVTGIVVLSCIATSLTSLVWFKTRSRSWRFASAWLGMSSATSAAPVAIFVPLEYIGSSLNNTTLNGAYISTYYFNAPGFGYVFSSMLVLFVVLFVMGCVALVRQRTDYLPAAYSVYGSPLHTRPAPGRVERLS